MTDLPARAPSPRRARTVPARQIQEECRLLEATLRRAKLATPEEIAAWRPGSDANPARDAQGWYTYVKRLQRLHARGDSSIVASPSGTGGTTAEPDDELIQRAQNEEPLRVDLTHPIDGTEFLLVRVLSGFALSHLDARDGLLNCCAKHLTALQRSNRPSDHELRIQLMDEVAYQETVCQWIVTSEAAPELPFDPLTDPRPTVPATFRKLHAIDAVRVFSAFHRLNGAPLAVLRRKVSVEDSTTPRAGSWRTFAAMLETQSNHQVPARRFWRNRGLVSLMATRFIAVQEEDRQAAEAKKKAEAEVKRGRR